MMPQGKDKAVIESLARWVVDEYKDKRKEDVDTSEWPRMCVSKLVCICELLQISNFMLMSCTIHALSLLACITVHPSIVSAVLMSMLQHVMCTSHGMATCLTACWCICRSPDNTPQQLNSCDCGVFTLMFADYQSRDANFTFDQRHMEYFRIKVIADIMGTKVDIPSKHSAEDSS